MMASETVGENIKRLRKAAKMTQEELAAATGLQRSLIGRYENGRRKIGVANLVKLAKGLKCEIGDIDERCGGAGGVDLPSIDDEMLRFVALNWGRLGVEERAAIIGTIAADIKSQESKMILPREQIRRV